MGKRMAAKLKDIRAKLRERMHENIGGTLKWLQSVVRGYFQYHAVPGNEERLKAFLHEVRRSWLRMLRRRSPRSRWTWKRFMERLGNLLPAVEILHPYPRERFDANIQGRNRVRESRQHGTVRGAAGNRCPYRDRGRDSCRRFLPAATHLEGAPATR
jgi:RNA-directed DNA polymerase